MAAANYPDQGSAFTQPEPITYSDYSRILEFLDRIRAKPFSYIDVFNTFARRNPREFIKMLDAIGDYSHLLEKINDAES